MTSATLFTIQKADKEDEFMKKKYVSPEMELLLFSFQSVMRVMDSDPESRIIRDPGEIPEVSDPDA